MRKLYADNQYKGNLVENRKDLQRMGLKLKRAKRIAFDTETTSTFWVRANLCGISISLGTRATTWYIPTGHVADDLYEGMPVCNQIRIDQAIEAVKPYLDNLEKEIIGHNLKFDMNILSKYGLWDYKDKWRIMKMKNFDNMLGMWLINENTPNDLKDGCKKYEIIDDMKPYGEIVRTVPNHVKKAHGLVGNKLATMDLVHTLTCAAYACDDAFGTYNLRKPIIKDMESEGMYDRFNKLEMPYQRVLYLKEQRGVKIDVKRMQKMSADIQKEMNKIAYDIYEFVGHEFNLNAPAQIGKVLFEELGFPIISKTKTGKPQVNADTVDILLEKQYKSKKMKEAQKVLILIDNWRKLSKHKGTFIDGVLEVMDDKGYVHTSFKQHGTVTGRISSAEPNLQNLPRPAEEGSDDVRAKFDIRACIIPDNAKTDRIFAGDESNLELRILAHFSEEPSFLDAFRNGQDIHSRTAVEFLKINLPVERIKKEAPEARQDAKTINFAIPYGTTAPTLAKSMPKGTTTEEAQGKLDEYFVKFKFISKFLKDTKRLAHKQGYTETILAKKRRVHEEMRDRRFWIQESGERMGVNAVIQGSAGDILKIVQIKVELDPWLHRWGFTQRIQVHDEIVGNGKYKNRKKTCQRLAWIMAHPFGNDPDDNLIVPLVAEPDYGMSWSEAK